MRRLLALAVLTAGLVLGTAPTAGALSVEPADPTTTTRPVVITEPEGIYDDVTTTTWAPIGGPDGDVVEPSLGDRLLPEAALLAGLVMVTAVAGVVAVQAQRRRA
ncbi:MAG TPA: hypothetical protein VF228_23555 [Iamia sp.]